MPTADLGPRTYDPDAFDQARYGPSSLELWVPHLIRLGQVAGGRFVLDVGCATGGFTTALARRTGASVVGLDLSLSLLRYARDHRQSGVRLWSQGISQDLPFASDRFDRVLFSLALHQIPEKRRALVEAGRVLRLHGRVVIRTVIPELADEWVETRYFPTYAELQLQRLTPLGELTEMLEDVGFRDVTHEIVRRNRPRTVDQVEASIRSSKEPHYESIPQSELEEGLARMRADFGKARFVDRRPHSFVAAFWA